MTQVPLLENSMFNVVFGIVLVGAMGIILGVYLGSTRKDLRLQYGLKVFIKAFLRITKKKWMRLVDPRVNAMRVQRDRIFLNLPDEKKARLVDAKALEVVVELKQQLSSQFGKQIKALYLFGSRVRGDFQPDSDLDVAIFLAESCDCSDFLRKAIFNQCSELTLKHDLFVQPRIFGQHQSKGSNYETDMYLTQIVMSYGIPV